MEWIESRTRSSAGSCVTRCGRGSSAQSSADTGYDDPSSYDNGSLYSSESSGQENARGQAENYLSMMAFSRKGLIEQVV